MVTKHINSKCRNHINKPYIYGLSFKGELVYIGLHNGKDPYYFSGGLIPNRIGKDKFIKGIIEYCNIENLVEKEIKYIELYKPKFNLTSGGETNEGTKHSIETILKRKESFMKNKKHLERMSKRFQEMNKNNNPAPCKKIKCIETNQTFKSIREASRILNIDNSHLAKHLKGKFTNVKNLTFKEL